MVRLDLVVALGLAGVFLAGLLRKWMPDSIPFLPSPLATLPRRSADCSLCVSWWSTLLATLAAATWTQDWAVCCAALVPAAGLAFAVLRLAPSQTSVLDEPPV